MKKFIQILSFSFFFTQTSFSNESKNQAVTTFAEDFIKDLDSLSSEKNAISFENFCKKFWKKSQLNSCKMLPFKSLNKRITLKKITPVGIEKGFLGYLIDDKDHFLMTYITEDDKYKIEDQNAEVWKEYTSKWFNETFSDSEMRFHLKPNENQNKELSNFIKNSQSIVKNIFGLTKSLDYKVLYLFVNNPQLNQDLGVPYFPLKGLGAMARDQFLLMQGNIPETLIDQSNYRFQNYLSVIIHETTHLYFRNIQVNILSEGIAEFSQYEYIKTQKFVINKEKNSKSINNYIKHFKEVKTALQEQMWEKTLDTESFFANKEIAYTMGGAIIFALKKHLGSQKMIELINSFTLTQSKDDILKQLYQNIEKEKLKTYSIEYIESLEKYYNDLLK